MTPAADKSLVRWPQTGLDAPYRFTITDFTYHELRDGVAFSASLVHPGLVPANDFPLRHSRRRQTRPRPLPTRALGAVGAG